MYHHVASIHQYITYIDWPFPLSCDTVGVRNTNVQFNPVTNTNKYGGNTAKHNNNKRAASLVKEELKNPAGAAENPTNADTRGVANATRNRNRCANLNHEQYFSRRNTRRPNGSGLTASSSSSSSPSSFPGSQRGVNPISSSLSCPMLQRGVNPVLVSSRQKPQR